MKSLLGLVAALLVGGVCGVQARADSPGVHGMVLFGERATYVSHLPMFHAPHDRQLILKVALADAAGARTLEAFRSSKREGETLFTIEPAPMDLEKVANGTLTRFPAELYAGHFERGGRALGKVSIRVEAIVCSAKLSARAGASDRYLVFGGSGEYFAAHVIGGRPSFDVILKTARPYELYVPHCRTRVCADPVKTELKDDQLPLTVSGPEDLRDFLPASTGVQLGELGTRIADVEAVLYSEECDLFH